MWGFDCRQQKTILTGWSRKRIYGKHIDQYASQIDGKAVAINSQKQGRLGSRKDISKNDDIKPSDNNAAVNY